MIVGFLSDPILRAALLRAAHPEEDVFVQKASCLEALEHGFPRVVIYVPEDGHVLGGLVGRLEGRLPTVTLTGAELRRWEVERRAAAAVPPSRIEHTALRLRSLLAAVPREPTVWVDRAMSDLQRAAGQRLPGPLRGFGRRVMESPARYGDLHPMAELAELSRGALKARFRRRELASPYVYLRWFRTLAVAHVLADPSITTLEAAHRLGFHSAGNLCRTIQGVTGMTPTEVRTRQGWQQLVMAFAWRHLDRESLEAWEDMDDLFLRGVA